MHLDVGWPRMTDPESHVPRHTMWGGCTVKSVIALSVLNHGKFHHWPAWIDVTSHDDPHEKNFPLLLRSLAPAMGIPPSDTPASWVVCRV